MAQINPATKTESINMEDALRADQFVDLKTAHQQDILDIEFNDRYKYERDKQTCWDSLDADEREEIKRGCSFPAFSDPLERWIAYSLRKEFALMRYGALWNRYQYDCDGSKSSEIVPIAINKLYGALWPELHADSGDTMNSFWTTCKQFLHLINPEKWPMTMSQEEALSNMIDNEGHLRGDIFEMNGLEKDEKDLRQKIINQLYLLAHLTHTIGDFIPCGGAFNSRRYDATKDYWDITLEYIRDWYINRSENSEFDTIFDADPKWLKFFGTGVKGWNTFVKKNFLKPYVDGEGGSAPYVVRHFFPGHDFSGLRPNRILPQNEKELLECLLSMNAAIIARGNLMRNRLIELNKNGEIDLGLFFEG